jgi:glycosyltransferase involved in cell wall biosynthesis
MMQQPKILQVIPGLHTGGAERTAFDIANAIVDRGWTSIVASSGGRMLDGLIANGSRHETLPLGSKNPVTIWRNAGRLARLIRRHDINLIHARSRAPAWSAWLAARRTGIPFVTTYHGSYNQNSRTKALYNSVMARGDVVIANSQWTANLIADRNPWARPQIQVVYRGTDFEKFRRESISADRLEALRQQWKLDTDDFVLVQLARLNRGKGHVVVVEAVARLIAEFPRLKVIFAGDAQGSGAHRALLEQKIADHGLQKHILLPGHCDDPAAAMALADIVVGATIQAEAFGRGVVEAGALERPVVVSRIGAVDETVLAPPEVSGDHRTGWKVSPGDPVELSQALESCIRLSSGQRDKIGQRARQHCEKKFSLQQMCDKTLKIYEKLIEPKFNKQSQRLKNH